MEINLLSSYLSRSQIREYLAYILEYGVDDIVESPDSVYATDPVPIRIGSSINSIKIFHVAKRLKDMYWLTQVSIALSLDDVKPNMPDDSSYVGIFYMSKYGRDYNGEPDLISGKEMQGDIGDVVWFDALEWDELQLGKTSDGTNYRLFVFWNATLMSEIAG